MTEKRPSTPKRTPRPRRRTTTATDNGAEGSSDLEHRTAEVPSKPAIEDAFEEAAAMRAEYDDRPTERDMDFEVLERRPAESSEAVERRVPRQRTPRPRASSRRAAADRAPEADAGSVEQPVSDARQESRQADDSFNDTAFAGDDFGAERSRQPGGGQEEGGRSQASHDEMGDPGPNEHGGYEIDDGSGPPPEGGEGYPDRRRRRRRRRGGRGGDQMNGPGGQQQGGYGRQPNRSRQGGPPHNGQRRPPQHHAGQHQQRPYNGPPQAPRADQPGVPVLGILELHPKGYGFLREAKAGYSSQETDPFVSSSIIQKLNLREGVTITGEAVSGGRGQGPRLRQIDSVEGRTIEAYQQIRSFDDLTAINPFEQIKLETGATPITMRIMDLLTPIGKGQRALIVAPPRTGKTMLLQEIADAVSKNHPEIYLMVLLIDERPEEVTEMRRRVRGEVIASSMDRDVESHVRVSQLIFERAKRMTESGRDVFILLDSITRTARAFNKWTSNTGRTMSGGLDVKAMDIPKKMFGQARRFEEGGSLTVVGTALIETGSRMDDVIFQEFKGTGNMEMVLSRDLADRRIWPAIDITKSGTRREEKILAPEVLEGVTLLRRSLVSMSPVEAMEQLSKTLAKFPSNADFLAKVRSVL
ncbi:MAG: transcription termination factor Rho [Planctomycetales bacterium 12-60-4]|nr:MAG: transcription termination factor Rho [Planctomycetales bacterium 12-60-4]